MLSYIILKMYWVNNPTIFWGMSSSRFFFIFLMSVIFLLKEVFLAFNVLKGLVWMHQTSDMVIIIPIQLSYRLYVYLIFWAKKPYSLISVLSKLISDEKLLITKPVTKHDWTSLNWSELVLYSIVYTLTMTDEYLNNIIFPE